LKTEISDYQPRLWFYEQSAGASGGTSSPGARHRTFDSTMYFTFMTRPSVRCAIVPHPKSFRGGET